MADTKISAMPTAATLDGTELVPLVQAGGNVQQTLENTLVQTFAVTRNIGLNTTSPSDYGASWSTLTVGGVNTINDAPTGGEIDVYGIDGSVTWMYQDGTNFNLEAQGASGAITISASTQLTLNTALKTNQLTGYLYGNGSSGNVTASTSIPSSALDIKYGSFFDTTTQTNGGATSANVMTFNTADLTNGVSIVTDSQITLATAGVYNIQFSSQFSRAGGTGFSTVDVWLSKNGANVTSSNTQVNVPNSGGKAVASWTFLVDASAGDYYELYWSSTDTSVVMFYIDSEINPTRPSIPSVILNVIQVS
jgi:hypothetical protein